MAALERAGSDIQHRLENLRQLPLDPRWRSATFGPDHPHRPDPLDDPNGEGFATPRIWQYPVAWNIPGRHVFRGHIGWEVLKSAADQPLFRACIEIRKQRISTLDWSFRISPEYAAKMARSSGKSDAEAAEDLRREFQEEIDRLTNFWLMPDRRNGYEFADWTGLLQEEQLVWDALAIYPQKTYGDDLFGLTILDGSTIKPLMDEQGGRPMPPFPAYQQIMYGYPRGDFTADTVTESGKVVVPGGYDSSQLIYRRRNIRTWTPYGFSPVEQALLDGQLWAKRFQWMISEYTEGSQAVQYLKQTQDSGWEAAQLLQYEKYLNDRLSGKTGERYRNPLLPFGVEPVNSAQVPERYKPDYDLFLIKLQAMHFGVTMPELGFSEPGGLGSSGYHEGQEDIQFRKDLTSVRWLSSLINSISRAHLNMPQGIEFCFLGLDEEDEAAADEIDNNRVQSARMTLNESRVKIGLPTFDFPEADMPMLMTQRGIVFLQGAAEAAPAGVIIEPAELQTELRGDTAAGGGQPKTKVQGSPKPARPVKQSPSAADSAAAAKELEQYGKWLAKGDPSRPFEFKAIDPETADHLGDLAARFRKAAGDADPKARSPYHQPSR
jgi:hypothetical protein